MICQTWISAATVALSAILGSYALFTLGLFVFWHKARRTGAAAEFADDLSITVIIPVRNEAANIGALLADLDRQTLPVSRFEVLIMDDSSTDSTAAIVQKFSSTATARIRLISLPEVRTSAPKKRAIETAIGQAQGKLIVTTDGDCRVGPGWLHAIARCYTQTGARLISSPVTFTREAMLTDHLQTVEFASLIGSGAASMSAGYPSMCNGANLAYEKEAFIQVNGYEGVKHIASGDDEFLMHKIVAAYPGGVRFLRDAEAIVRTAPHRDWASFYRQRKRWASKWKHYQSKTPLVLAVYIFGCNLALLAATALWLSGWLGTPLFLSLIALKCIPEWVFLGSVLTFLRKSRSLLFIPLTQCIYPFYVCFFGLAAQKPEYEWKGRKLV